MMSFEQPHLPHAEASKARVYTCKPIVHAVIMQPVGVIDARFLRVLVSYFSSSHVLHIASSPACSRAATVFHSVTALAFDDCETHSVR